jgi:hypothetical protein
MRKIGNPAELHKDRLREMGKLAKRFPISAVGEFCRETAMDFRTSASPKHRRRVIYMTGRWQSGIFLSAIFLAFPSRWQKTGGLDWTGENRQKLFGQRIEPRIARRTRMMRSKKSSLRSLCSMRLNLVRSNWWDCAYACPTQLFRGCISFDEKWRGKIVAFRSRKSCVAFAGHDPPYYFRFGCYKSRFSGVFLRKSRQSRASSDIGASHKKLLQGMKIKILQNPSEMAIDTPCVQCHNLGGICVALLFVAICLMKSLL